MVKFINQREKQVMEKQAKVRAIYISGIMALIAVVLLLNFVTTTGEIALSEDSKEIESIDKLSKETKDIKDIVGDVEADLYLNPKKTVAPAPSQDKFSSITIKNMNGLGSKIQDLNLVHNVRDSPVTGYGDINITIYQKAQLLDGLKIYENDTGIQASYVSQKYYVFLPVNVTVTENTYNVSCTTSGNGTNCATIVNGTKNKVITQMKKLPYNYEVMPAGNYQVRVEAEGLKPEHTYEWYPSTLGIEIFEYAPWNVSWVNYKAISGSTGSLHRMFVPNVTGMNWSSGYSDIRFTNIENTTKLNFTFIPLNASGSYHNVTGFMATVDTGGVEEFIMWYNNPTALSDSNATAVYGQNLLIYLPLEEADGTSVYDLTGKANGTTTAVRINANFSRGLQFNNDANQKVSWDVNGRNHLNFTGDVGIFAQMNDSKGSGSGFYMQDCGSTINADCISLVTYASSTTSGRTSFLANGLNGWQSDVNTNIQNVWNGITWGSNLSGGRATKNAVNITTLANIGTGLTSLQKNANGVQMFLGARANNGEVFGGQVDEFGIWNRMLTPLEEKKLNNQTKGGETIGAAGTTALPDTFAPNLSYGVTTLNSSSVIAAYHIITNATAQDETGLTNITTRFYNISGVLINETNLASSGTAQVSQWLNLSVPRAGIYFFNSTACDAAPNCNLTETRNVTIDSFPTIRNIGWVTTGGFSSSSLVFGQVLANITVNSTDFDNQTLVVNVTLTDPLGAVAINNLQLSNTSFTLYNITKNTNLNVAGNWTINITSYDGFVLNSSSTTFTVSTLSVGIKDGFYGYANNRILSGTDISGNSTQNYDLYETSANFSNMNSTWASVLASIANISAVNAKAGLNYYMDVNVSNTSIRNLVKMNITNQFGALLNAPYYGATIYLSLEFSNLSLYTNSEKDTILNDLAANITSITQNKFVLYSKNYNSSNLSSQYISFTTMNYLNATDEAGWVNQEAQLAQNSTSLNRIYVNPTAAMQPYISLYQNNILGNLRSGINITGINNKTATINGGDLIVFNNLSTGVIRAINFTGFTIVGKDFWDATNHQLVANDSNTLVLPVNVSAYGATMVLADDLGHILMTSDTASTLYKTSGTVVSDFNYSKGTGANDGNLALYGANDVRIELFDPHYVRNNFITYYGWLNVSNVNFSAVHYDTLIIADKNTPEVAKLNCTSGACYGYISVADFANTNQWQSDKQAEVDSWIAINASMNLFIDGLDIGLVGATNFTSRFKELVDYVRITKGKLAILNTYTAYEQFSTYGDAVMKESCVMRWNGANAGSPDNYTFENWDLEMNKSRWYQSHGIDVYCQAFTNRSTNPFMIENYSVAKSVFFASKVLGYENFYITQPDFQYAWTEFFPNVGTDLSNDFYTNDNQTYYRRYSNGIVYYNSSSHYGWIDDGKTVNNVQACFNLYDAHANNVNFDFYVNKNPASPPTSGDYSIPDSSLTLFDWKRVCQTINASDDGRYVIDAYVNPRNTIVGQGVNIGFSNIGSAPQASWYDATAGAYSWIAYGQQKNHDIDIIVNQTTKTAIDSFTGKITQAYSNANGYYNLTLSSATAYNLPIYSNMRMTNTLYLTNITYVNGARNVLNTLLSNTCTTNNPVFATTSISGQTYGACYSKNSTSVSWRVQMPSLSGTRSFSLETDIFNPNATLVFPTNNSNSSTPSQLFNVTYTDNLGVKNGTISIYNASGLVNSSTVTFATNGTTSTIHSFFSRLGNGIYTWFAKLFDWEDNSYTSENFTLNVLATPTVDFQAPTPSNNTLINNRTILVNITGVSGGIDTAVLSVNRTDGTINNQTMTCVGTTSYACNKMFTSSTDGNISFNVWVNATGGNNNISLTRIVEIDATAPNNTINSTDLNITVANGALPYTLSLNVSTNDSHPAFQWYRVTNAIGVVIQNTTFTGNNFSVSFPQYDFYTVFYATNDSATNLNESNITVRTLIPSPVTDSSGVGGSSGGGSAGSNNTILCNYIYDSIVSKGGSRTYSNNEIIDLTSLINANLNPDVTEDTVKIYVSDYSARCTKALPTVKNQSSSNNLNATFFATIINYDGSSAKCAPEINATLTILNAKYKMDTSIPTPDVSIGNRGCLTVTFSKWIFELSKTGSTYSITGIKLWWVVSVVIVGGCLLIYRAARRSMKARRQFGK